jgi:hypothetical protein
VPDDFHVQQDVSAWHHHSRAHSGTASLLAVIYGPMTPMRRAPRDGRSERVVRLLTSDQPVGDGGESLRRTVQRSRPPRGLSRAYPPFVR